MGPDLSSAAGALGKPDVDQILECRAKAWWHDPTIGEVLALNTARWATGGLHAMRPPVIAEDDFDLEVFRTQTIATKQKTWCGWKYSMSNGYKLSIWNDTLANPEFCPRCFGKKSKPDDPISSSSSSSS